jgi:hypothetical protein
MYAWFAPHGIDFLIKSDAALYTTRKQLLMKRPPEEGPIGPPTAPSQGGQQYKTDKPEFSLETFSQMN